MSVLKSWSRSSKKRVDVLEITEDKVFVVCHEAGDCSALGCSREEFLAGKLQQVVLRVFGAQVLEEVLAWLARTH